MIRDTEKRVIGERWRLERPLGESTMGRSYLAEDVSGRSDERPRRAVVRELYPSRLADWKDFERFERAAQVLADVDHRGVPGHLGAWVEGEPPSMVYYSAREYVEGETLAEAIERGQRFGEAAIRRLARQLLDVLQTLHRREPAVVHRDIKPANIVLADRREAGGAAGGADPEAPEAVLIDFGAVREVVRATMQAGSTVIGTWGYMAPEQFMGEAEPASDLFSLGATLMSCLTHDDPPGIDAAVIESTIAALNVSDGLKSVLRRLCAPRREDRYETAREVLEDLESLEAGRPPEHAERRQQALIERRERQLERASSGSRGGYLALMTGGVTLAVGGVMVVLGLFGVPLATGIVVAGGLSGLGATVARYLDFVESERTTFEAPGSDWIRTRATVVRTSKVRHGGKRRWELTYEYSTRGKTHRRTLIWPPVGGRRPEVGQKLEVFYAPTDPTRHRIQHGAQPTDRRA